MNEELIAEIKRELEFANSKWPPFNSAHEALGVIQEEFKEFCEDVYLSQNVRSSEHMRKELIQLAAMAIRAASVCTNEWVLR